jgi:hypothetical protein
MEVLLSTRLHQFVARFSSCRSPPPCWQQLDDMRRAFMLRGAVVTALVHGDTGDATSAFPCFYTVRACCFLMPFVCSTQISSFLL